MCILFISNYQSHKSNLAAKNTNCHTSEACLPRTVRHFIRTEQELGFSISDWRGSRHREWGVKYRRWVTAWLLWFWCFHHTPLRPMRQYLFLFLSCCNYLWLSAAQGNQSSGLKALSTVLWPDRTDDVIGERQAVGQAGSRGGTAMCWPPWEEGVVRPEGQITERWTKGGISVRGQGRKWWWQSMGNKSWGNLKGYFGERWNAVNPRGCHKLQSSGSGLYDS